MASEFALPLADGETRNVSDMVSVDRRQGELFIASYSTTFPGFQVMNGWLRRLSADAEEAAIGLAIEAGLDASETGIKPPGRDEDPAAPLLAMAGVSSYGAYMWGTQSVSVLRDGPVVTVEPTRNKGSRGGFTPLQDRADVLHAPTNGQLGRTVREALERAV